MFRQKQFSAAIFMSYIAFYCWLSVNNKLAIALNCYENEVNNDEDTTSVKISIDSSWSLCVLSFSLSSNSGVKLGNGTLFGIGPESEELSPVEAVLSVSSNKKAAVNAMLRLSYEILEVCILERYDISELHGGRHSRHSSQKSAKNIEHTFRCFCNTDLCNSKSNFKRQLNALITDK